MTDKPGGKRGRKPRAAPPNLLASLMDEWVHLGRMILDYRADVESMELHEQAAQGLIPPGESTPEGIASLKRRIRDSEPALAEIRNKIEKRWRDTYDECGGEIEHWHTVAVAVKVLQVYMEAGAATDEESEAVDFVRCAFDDLRLPFPEPLLTAASSDALADFGAKRAAVVRMGEMLGYSERGLRGVLERFCSDSPDDPWSYPDPNLGVTNSRGRRFVFKNEDAETSVDTLINMLRDVLHAREFEVSLGSQEFEDR